jgi:hypothetical protein
MGKSIKPCTCASTEFISNPSGYDIYEIINGKLEFQRSELIEDDCKLFCRNCGKELKQNNRKKKIHRKFK